jgi:hypothetical protein
LWGHLTTQIRNGNLSVYAEFSDHGMSVIASIECVVDGVSPCTDFAGTSYMSGGQFDPPLPSEETRYAGRLSLTGFTPGHHQLTLNAVDALGNRGEDVVVEFEYPAE